MTASCPCLPHPVHIWHCISSALDRVAHKMVVVVVVVVLVVGVVVVVVVVAVVLVWLGCCGGGNYHHHHHCHDPLHLVSRYAILQNASKTSPMLTWIHGPVLGWSSLCTDATPSTYCLLLLMANEIFELT